MLNSQVKIDHPTKLTSDFIQQEIAKFTTEKTEVAQSDDIVHIAY